MPHEIAIFIEWERSHLHFSKYVRQCVQKPELTGIILHLLHVGFDASRMAAGQMAGLMEGLGRGMLYMGNGLQECKNRSREAGYEAYSNLGKKVGKYVLKIELIC